MTLDKKIQVYSNVLLDLSKDYKATEVYIDEIDSLIEVIDSTEFNKLFSLLANQTFDLNYKKDIIKNVFDKIVSKIILNFLFVLAENNDFGSARGIFMNFKMIASEHLGFKSGVIWTARKINDNTIESIKLLLEKKYKLKFTLINKVDKKLIGGLRIVFDDFIIDKSIKSQLTQLKTELKEK